MELLILGDSLAFGRPKHGIYREKTWPFIIQQRLYSHVCMRAVGGSTIIDVLREANVLKNYWAGPSQGYLFDAIFIQAGIVDTTPRLLPRKFYPYASVSPVLSVFIAAGG